MTRLLTCIVIMLLTVIIPAKADEPKLTLKGNVYEATFGAGIVNAKVYLLDSLGVAIDSTKTGTDFDKSQRPVETESRLRAESATHSGALYHRGQLQGI